MIFIIFKHNGLKKLHCDTRLDAILLSQQNQQTTHPTSFKAFRQETM